MNPNQLAEVSNFVARLQADNTHNIPYFGTTIHEITEALQEWDANWQDRILLAHENEKLIGFIGVESDQELGRVWIHGPMVDHVDWHQIADDLYTRARANIIPPDIKSEELLGDGANINLKTLAERHDFSALKMADSLILNRSKQAALPQIPVEAPEITPTQYDAFIQLHDAIFPGTYYSGKQIVEKLNGQNKVFVAIENNTLQGYIYARMNTGTEGYIDFVGVAESARQRGIGTRLIITAIRWLFSFDAVQDVALTVFTDNQSAILLYKQLGFEHLRTMQGFRRFHQTTAFG
jgi:ribosomal protein S18 acetylase RimI-like enzyme